MMKEEMIKDVKWIASRKRDAEGIESNGIKHLEDLEMELEKRKGALEKKMLELYSLKEQQSYIAHLQRNLEDKNAEIHNLGLAINALTAEIKDIQEEGTLARKQLSVEKKMLEDMQMIREINSDRVKRQILVLEERLSGFNKHRSSATDALVEKKIDSAKNIEVDVVSMRRRNKELELEKRELAIKIAAANARITAISKIKESETMAKVEDEISMLKCSNEDLSREVERLQKNRFDMVEELVYQRWLSACLRYEMQDHQTPRKTSDNEMKKTLDQKHYQRTKVLISEASTDGYSSQTSSTQSEEADWSSFGSSSSSQRSINNKKSRKGINQMFRKTKSGMSVDSSLLKSSRGSPLKKIGLLRRFSTSMVPSKSSMLCKKNVQEPTESLGMLSSQYSTRQRRVSFNDVVEILSSANIDREELAEGAIDDRKIVSDRPIDKLTAKAGSQHQVEIAGEQPEISSSPQVTITKPWESNNSTRSTHKYAGDAKVDTGKETAQTEELDSRATNILAKESKNDTYVKLHNAAFFIFILTLLVYSFSSYWIS